MSRSHFIACGMLRWKGFAGILLYRHIKAFITLYCVCGSKEDSTLLSTKGSVRPCGGWSSWACSEEAGPQGGRNAGYGRA